MSLLGRLTAILLVSGFCSLVYQVVWLRLLRLIFGASTASTAAVLAIFMGGLGLGGLLLGRRVDRSPRPLVFYSRLEFGIALTAALSPPLIALLRWVYLGLGGTPQLGVVPGTLLRLAVSAVVLGVPAFLMGGTLPAAVRAIERVKDRGRRSVGLLYGVNTLGAVLGTLWATFVSIERAGLQRSLWVAALLNLLIAVFARALARAAPDAAEPGAAEPAERPDKPTRQTPEATEATVSPPHLRPVLAAAFLVGFVFFLMELVWYRMLAPILGGSSYTFGLILAVALTGIGVGGLIYGLGARERRPTLTTFAGTCALQAVAVALPFALGDRIAFLALATRDLNQGGLAGMVFGWALVTAIVVLPAALVAGYQFPVLVGLLGSGRREVGREVGLAYAWNTAGAILGSVAGGFGLLPLLTAPGAWRLSAAVLALLGLAYLWASRRATQGRSAAELATDLESGPTPSLRRWAAPAALALTALAMLGATGPTAAWRHTGIGAGRLSMPDEGPNGLHAAFTLPRNELVWEEEGLESSVALRAGQDYSFQVNGKTDGSALGDAPTQVMSGLVGALLHPDPKKALVIGLGTGSSAGWLADVPGMERVDVVELEPAIRKVAEWMSAVNRDVLTNPRARLLYGDAREHLLTTSETYDVIFSEPSNPYRAGISSLFTRELYQAAAERLGPQGIFLQWLQAYEVDSLVVRTAYATLFSVFGHVETWQVHDGDLLLVAAREPIDHHAERIRQRVVREPFASALLYTWGVSGLEGFYSGYVAGPGLTRQIAGQPGVPINTDDHPVIEFGFVRNLGRKDLFSISELHELARFGGHHRPPLEAGTFDPQRVEDLASARQVILGKVEEPRGGNEAKQDSRIQARRAFQEGDFQSAVRAWTSQPEEPRCRADWIVLATSLARIGDAGALDSIDRLRELRPLEADAILALWYAVERRAEPARRQYLRVLRTAREDPWIHESLMTDVLQSAVGFGRTHPEIARELFDALSEPFAAGLVNGSRLKARIGLAAGESFERLCIEALAPIEPHPFWEREILAARAACYEHHRHPLATRARKDLERFLDAEPPPLFRTESDPW